MGLFWDKLKAIFKGRQIPVLELEKIDIYKQSTAPARLVAVGFGKEYSNHLAIRKQKSQSRNWSKWRKRK